jgi:hypothetical protein
VEEAPGTWALYFDREDAGLIGRVGKGVSVLEVELARVEKKWIKDPVVRAMEQGTVQPVMQTEEREQSIEESRLVCRKKIEREVSAARSGVETDMVENRKRRSLPTLVSSGIATKQGYGHRFSS